MFPRRSACTLLAAIALLIVYGSLYPFQFESPAALSSTLARFATQWGSDGRLTDLLGNVALFLPLGFAAALVSGSRLVAVLGSVVLALVLQLAQLWLPDRIAALNDVFWNGAGAAIGAFAARWAVRQPAAGSALRGLDPAPVVLLLLWVAAEALPLVPGLGWQEFKDSIKPLLRAPRWDLGWFLVELSMALAALELLRALRSGRSMLAEIGVLGGVLVLQVVVVTRALELTTVSAFVLAWMLWWPLSRQSERRRRGLLIGALLAAFTLEAVLPLRPAAALDSFHWLPFASLLSGSLLAGAINGARLLFTFAVTLWLLRRAGGRLLPATIALALWVFLLELAQVLLEGHTADITPVLLVLAAAWGVAVLEHQEVAPVRASVARSAASPPVQASGPAPGASRGWLVAGIVLTLVLATAIHVLVGLPGVPYNVGELFRGDVPFLAEVVFALALLWIGVGPALTARRLTAARHAWVELPLLTIGVSLVSLLLFAASVTEESLMDVVGSNNLNWFVIHRQIWGEGAAELFRRLDAPGLVAFVERPVRFTALLAPLFLTLALFGAAALALRLGRFRWQRWLLLVVAALPWFWLCKAIAFDWSSTDNLNELIARQGAWGTGGGFYLYLLLLLFGANAVGVASVRRRRGAAAAVVGTAAALAVSWWLLTHGLEPQVQKYGNVFSGAQFLLGPDRTQLLPPSELLLRWAIVYLGGLLVVAAGFRLGAAGAQDLMVRFRPPVAPGHRARQMQSTGQRVVSRGET